MTSKAQVALEEYQGEDTKCKNDGSNQKAASKKACVAPKTHDGNTNTKDIKSSWKSTTSSSKQATIEDVSNENDQFNNGKSMQSPFIELVVDPEDELGKLYLCQQLLLANMQSTACLMKDWTPPVYMFFELQP